MPLGDFKKILLTREQEHDLIIQAQRPCVCKGDHTLECNACEAKSKIVEYNLRWLFKMCIDHVEYTEGLDLHPEELLADAIEGFTEAIGAIDPNKPERLITYAKRPVVSALLASDLTAGVIAIPAWVRQLRRRVKKFVAKSLSEGKNLTWADIAKEVKQSETTVRNALKPVECELGLSIDAERDKYSDKNSSRYIKDYDEKISYMDSEEWIAISDAEILMSCLEEEEREIVAVKLGIGCKKLTNAEIKEKFGYTRRKTTNIYKQAIAKMKEKAGVE